MRLPTGKARSKQAVPRHRVQSRRSADIQERAIEKQVRREGKQQADAAFMAWAESFKPCKRCKRRFYGPVCECETGS